MSRGDDAVSAAGRDELARRACELLPLLRTYVRLHSDAMLRQRESCSDMVQSALGDCLEDLAGFEYRGEPAFRKWLFQKVHSKILDRRRHWLAERRDVRREQPLPDGDDVRASFATVSQNAMRNEDLAALEACFEQLTGEHRRVVVAVKLFGQSHAEVAAELGCSEGAARMLLHRALARLGMLMCERGH
jgi:RNA polymerase sigma factor (sigma-70 family)